MSYGKFRLIDLFCGCGGMTQGFMDTKQYSSVFANDFNAAAIESYKANFDKYGKHSFCGDIIEILDNKLHPIPKADVVIGGPPCQGFSLLNKKRDGDPRRRLWVQFMRIVELSQASVVVMENVPQLLSSYEFEEICMTLSALNFKYIEADTLIAANYGVPEIRKRAIIMASKDAPISLPRPTHINPKKKQADRDFFSNIKLEPWTTVQSAIGDLPKPEGTEIRNVAPPLNLHFGRTPTDTSLERYKAVPPGGNRFDLQKNRPDITPNCWIKKKSGGTDLFGRLWWDRPSVTIRTEFFKPEKGRYLHPEQNRPITHREAARIQSFNDHFIFKGSKIEIAKQIGNAVPPLLAKAIAEEVYSCLKKETEPQYVAETNEGIKYLHKLNGAK